MVSLIDSYISKIIFSNIEFEGSILKIGELNKDVYYAIICEDSDINMSSINVNFYNYGFIYAKETLLYISNSNIGTFDVQKGYNIYTKGTALRSTVTISLFIQNSTFFNLRNSNYGSVNYSFIFYYFILFRQLL